MEVRMNKRLLTSILIVAMSLISLGFYQMEGTKAEAAITGVTSDAVIMSYNLLTTSTQPITATNAEGTKTRGQMFIDLLEDKQPDSIGLCEITSSWEAYLKNTVITNAFTGGATYGITGLTSNSNLALTSSTSEFSPILYRSDKYDLVESGGYWFSDTPNARSKYGNVTDSNGNILHNGMTYNRVFSYAVFKFKNTQDVAYIHINAHFDHNSSDYINLKCSKQVRELADSLRLTYEVPVVLTGDYNTMEGTNAYHYLANGDHGFVNSKYVSDNYSAISSCPGYGSNYNPNLTAVIDHIFVSNANVGVYEHNIIPNQYLSDHSCVYARVSFNSKPSIDGITVNKVPVSNFSHEDIKIAANTKSSSAVIEITANESYQVYLDDVLVKEANMAITSGTVTRNLVDGSNNLELCVENSQGARTIYQFDLYKNYGNPQPIISEIYPNADAGYKYFEVTNVGTSYFNTNDYYYLWGNIPDDTNRTWDGAFPVLESEHVDVKPGDSVVFWFTYGGTFSQGPTIKDFNDKYGTYLSDEDIVISDVRRPLEGYISGLVTKTYTMGANRSRGMRIAQALDSNGNPYPWSAVGSSGDAVFHGPTISISSYHNISSNSLTSTQLFKFKDNSGTIKTTVSDILSNTTGTPGVYDTRLGNEIRNAYTRIEAEDYDGYSLLTKTDGIVGNSRDNSWAYYTNIDFGTGGAQAALFYGAVKGSNAAGTIQVYIGGAVDGDLTNATLIGTCTVTATSPSDWGTYALFSGRFNQTVTGTHNVTLKFLPSLTYVINLDYFEFVSYREAETVDSFTNGIDINGNPTSANLQLSTTATGMSANMTNGYNLVGNTVNGGTVKYLNVDFQDGGKTGIVFHMALRTSRCYGTIRIYLLNSDGSTSHQIGYCTLLETDATDSGTGNYNTYKEFYGVITDNTVSGLRDIKLEFVTPTYYVGNIDYFYLYK